MTRPASTYKDHRYPIEILARAVWLYFRFNVSLRPRPGGEPDKDAQKPTRLRPDLPPIGRHASTPPR